ncbi:MAG: ATP-binding cassette domain-containing protein [Magnetococcales bacterium]|nr:ATP-binding cassette domain-containing protein [Magnetococcales bacterium]
MVLDRLNGKWWEGVLVVPGVARNAVDMIFATAAINLAALAVPIVLMQVYDRIIPNQSGATLVWLVAGCAVAILIDTVVRWARGVMGGWMGARFEHLVGSEAVDRILNCRIEVFESHGIGVHLDRLGTVGTLKGFYIGQLFLSALDLPFAALYFGAIAYVGGHMALFPLVIAGLFVVVIAYARTRFRAARDGEHTINDRRYNFIIETLAGIHLVKAQTMEEQMLRRYERLQGAAAEANMSVGFWGTIPVNAGMTLSQITMFGMMLLGTVEVIHGDLTVGGMSACVMLAGRALQPVQSAIGLWFRFSDATLARRRLADIAGLDPDGSPDRPAFPIDIQGAVELRDVVFRYRPELPPVVDAVSLRIPPESVVAITGAGACGTTTLLHLIMGRLKPQSGRVLIDDYDIAEWDHTDLRGRIDYVAPSGTLFKGTILDNIAMFDPTMHGAALAAAAMLGLDEPVGLLPLGYETMVDNQASNFLPSGLVQRICIARSLVTRPRVLLFDKTSSSMDHESEEVFLWLLSKLKGRCTIVLVASQPRWLELADEVYVMAGGRLHRVETSRDEGDADG